MTDPGVQAMTEQLLFTLLGFSLTPFLLLLALIIVPGTFGVSLGIRRFYISLLLKLFEKTQPPAQFGKERIALALQENASKEGETDNHDVTSTTPSIEVTPSNEVTLPNGEKVVITRRKRPSLCEEGLPSLGKTPLGVEDVVVPQRKRKAPFDGEEEDEDVLPPLRQTTPNGKLTPHGKILTPRTRKQSIKLIQKDYTRYLADGIMAESNESLKVTGDSSDQTRIHHEFCLSDAFYFCKKGVEAMVDDEVTKRFSAEELQSWNLLTRTSMRYQYLGMKLTILWGTAFLFRYLFLLPIRIIALTIGLLYLLVASAFIGYLPDGKLKKWINKYVSLSVYKMLLRCITCLVTFHNRENRAKGGGICVANHTSPIDVILLSSDNCYAFIGQKHTAFTGMIQRAMSRSGTDHIWFDRFEMKDRKKVSQRLTEHVEDAEKLPMLIFPEGTCINNTSVMMFKKGSFEIGGIIYPVAVKYDARFGDPFWNSSKFSMVRYIVMMLTSWAIVCDVWYLPPMEREEGEEAVDFANRVKAEIAQQGGLVDLDWDGQLKRMHVKSNLKEKEQEEYSKLIKSD